MSFAPFDIDHDKEPADAPIDLKPVTPVDPLDLIFCNVCFSDSCEHCAAQRVAMLPGEQGPYVIERSLEEAA